MVALVDFRHLFHNEEISECFVMGDFLKWTYEWME